ncbi:MAG: ZIP family metal transporter [Solirubrobacteraceae bacterium]
MSFAETVLLGAIAGITIYIGLPLGRMERVSQRTRLALAMFSVGILAFIFMDVSSHGEAIIATTLETYKHNGTGLGHAILLFALLAVGFTAGTAGIGTAERRLRNLRRAAPPPIAGGAQGTVMAVPQAQDEESQAQEKQRAALRTGMTIAVAIGLHNFAEGLAIGVSAKSGAIGLATVLVIGFALHNATEGFGIVGPLGGVKPPWRWLALAGLIGGGPTFLGTIVGYQVDSSSLQLAFYALAGGAILYVIGEIWTGVRRLGHRELGLYMLAFGFLLGIATDLVVSYGGA